MCGGSVVGWVAGCACVSAVVYWDKFCCQVRQEVREWKLKSHLFHLPEMAFTLLLLRKNSLKVLNSRLKLSWDFLWWFQQLILYWLIGHHSIGYWLFLSLLTFNYNCMNLRYIPWLKKSSCVYQSLSCLVRQTYHTFNLQEMNCRGNFIFRHFTIIKFHKRL